MNSSGKERHCERREFVSLNNGLAIKSRSASLSFAKTISEVRRHVTRLGCFPPIFSEVFRPASEMERKGNDEFQPTDLSCFNALNSLKSVAWDGNRQRGSQLLFPGRKAKTCGKVGSACDLSKFVQLAAYVQNIIHEDRNPLPLSSQPSIPIPFKKST